MNYFGFIASPQPLRATTQEEFNKQLSEMIERDFIGQCVSIENNHFELSLQEAIMGFIVPYAGMFVPHRPGVVVKLNRTNMVLYFNIIDLDERDREEAEYQKIVAEWTKAVPPYDEWYD